MLDELFIVALIEIDRLRRLNESLINRMAAMCEVLCRKSNRLPQQCPHCGGEIEIGKEDN